MSPAHMALTGQTGFFNFQSHYLSVACHWGVCSVVFLLLEFVLTADLQKKCSDMIKI